MHEDNDNTNVMLGFFVALALFAIVVFLP